jgi:hypothetical protein
MEFEIDRFLPDIEKPFRAALGYAIRNEFDDLKDLLLGLDDDTIRACLSLCAAAAGYTVHDVCDFTLPDEANLRHIAQQSTRSNFARAFGLKSQDVYDYIKRVVFGLERLDLVFADADDYIILAFKMTGHILGAYHPENLSIWEYLNRIEDMTEVAAAADMNVMPALILRLQWHGRPPRV